MNNQLMLNYKDKMKKIQKVKWSDVEEKALKAGVARHGVGKWKKILIDPEFAPHLTSRSNIDLKDKWRNINLSCGQGLKVQPLAIAYDVCSTSKFQSDAAASALVSLQDVVDDRPRSPTVVKRRSRWDDTILEAILSLNNRNGSTSDSISSFIEEKYKVPKTFRRSLSKTLSGLVLQGRLEKVENHYMIKDTAMITKLNSATVEALERCKMLTALSERADAMLLLSKEISKECLQRNGKLLIPMAHN